MTITITVNGEERQVSEAWAIPDLLSDLGINSRYCAVERNAVLVPREQHGDCQLEHGDRIEVVTLVGGG